MRIAAEPLFPEQLGKVMEPLNQVKLINSLDITFVEELHVRWVDGRELTLENVGVDKLEVVVAR
ncbi:MAG: hypothetical protein JSV68_05020 [Anaerolineaceae bacterium]|nr:MAG: hypothetical protein JSV68_05020 [Anaerolineaceae bacterium]